MLSRFELKELKTYRMPSDDIQRAAMALRVDMGGRSIWVMNVHFGLEAPERAEQIEWVANKAENLSMDAWKGLPFIIGGDLNTEPRDPIMGRINSTAFGGMTWNASYPSLELESPWHSVPESGRNRDMDHHTFPTSAYDLKEEHIDYILLSDGLEPIEAWIGDGEDASDHRPIWADVKVL